MKEFVCIVCPAGCRLCAEETGGGVKVSGHTCPRGEEYGRSEYKNPMRMLTTTVLCENGVLPRLPVISEGELPKAKLSECLAELYRLKVTAPVKRGDIIAENICGTGVNVLASRTMNIKKGDI